MYYLDNKILFFGDTHVVADINGINHDTIEEIIDRYDSGRSYSDICLTLHKQLANKNLNLDDMLPYRCGINLTNECQLRCNYCSYCSGEINDDTIDFNRIHLFIDYIVQNYQKRRKLNIPTDIPYIHFAGGGEPTYHWDLFTKSVEYIKEIAPQYRIGITTNGMLTKQQAEYLSKKIDTIYISYDGISYVQNKNRMSLNNKSSSVPVENTLRILNDSSCDFSIRSTIWPDDYRYLTEMADNIFINYPKIRSWHIEPVLQLGRAKRSSVFDEENYNNILVADFVSFFTDAREYVQNKYNTYIYTSMIKEQFACYNCGTAFAQFPWLNADGDIFTCLDARDEMGRIGHVTSSNMQLFDFYDTLNKTHIERMNSMCKNCIALAHCGGGCPLKHSYSDDGKRKNITSFWDCNQKQKYWKDLIDNLLMFKKCKNYVLVPMDSYKNITIYQIEYLQEDSI